MTFIEDTIYAHDFNNPPETNSGCNFDIVLASSTNTISLQKEGTTRHQTKYRLKVNEPQKLGFGSLSDQSARRKFIRTVLSSCNLLLRNAALSDRQVSLSESTFDNSIPPRKEGNTITLTPTNFYTEVFSSISGREDLSEKQVISVIGLLKILNNTNSGKGTHNMKKSLLKFDEAMGTDINRMSIFSLLCNSLEIASFYDSDIEGGDWAEKVTEVIGASLKIGRDVASTYDVVSGWRTFYNRTKHADENKTKVSSFLSGQENVPLQIGPLRDVTQKVIIDRLGTIAH